MNIFLNTKTTKIGLIALSLFGTIAVSLPLNFTVNPLLAQGNLSTNEGKKAQAEKLYDEADKLYQEGTKESLEKAMLKWKQALLLYEEIGDKSNAAFTLVWIGVIYDNLGFKLEALNYYHRSLKLYQQIKDKENEGNTLIGIGKIYSELGEKQKALEYYEQSLVIAKTLNDQKRIATNLGNIGLVYSELGEKQKALEYYQQSLLLSKSVGHKLGEANILNSLGAIYSGLGEKQKALEYYQQSLLLLKTLGDREREANTLNNIGVIYSELGKKQTALEYYQQSLLLSKAVGSRLNEAKTLNYIGNIYADLGEEQADLKTKEKALKYYQLALPLHQAVSNRNGEANTFNNLGLLYLSLGEKHTALKYLQQSLPLYKAVSNRSGEANTLRNIAAIEYEQDNQQSALTHIKSAVAIIEDLRTKIISQDLRTSYFSTVQDYYQLYIKILMKLHKQNPNLGYNITAFEVSEQARSRSLLDLLNESKADIRKGVDPQLKQKERELIEKLTAKTQEQLKLTSANEDKTAQLKVVVKEIDEIKTQLQQLEVKIRTTNPRYAAVTQAQTLKLQDIQQQLDKDTVLLSYWLGEQESYLWVITPASLTSYLLPNKTEIKTLAGDFLGSVIDPTSSAKKARSKAIALTQIILKPAAEKLQNKRLIIVSDGKLQYIPFGALANLNSTTPADFKPLLFDHEIINLPSASTIGFIRQDLTKRKMAPKTLMVFADPVFGRNDDRVKTDNLAQNNSNSDTSLRSLNLERITRSLGKRSAFARLPGTRTEAEKILSLVPKSASKKLFDFDVNLTNINNDDLSQYRIIHFATHGILNQNHPELSGIVLSLVDKQGKDQNGLLMTPDIFNLNLPADLIVLSACETALGKDVQGEGIVGLTRGFMYAGTSRLMLSLWQVDDKETAELMSRLYQIMFQEKLTPAAALRKAQLSMWKDGKAPYYWSAFILQGEWN